MNKIIVLIWTLVLGQCVGYIGSSLSQGPYDVIQVTIVSIIAAILIMIIGEVALPTKKRKSK